MMHMLVCLVSQLTDVTVVAYLGHAPFRGIYTASFNLGAYEVARADMMKGD